MPLWKSCEAVLRFILIIVIFLVSCQILPAQPLADFMAEAETMMKYGQFDMAKYHLMLGLGDAQEDISSYPISFIERYLNDIDEAKIRSGDYISVSGNFSIKTQFCSQRELIRRYHLNSMWLRSQIIRSYYGGRQALEQAGRCLEEADKLLQAYKNDIPDASRLERDLLNEMLLLAVDSENSVMQQQVLTRMKPLVEAVPYGVREWPALYWTFIGANLLEEKAYSQAADILNKALNHMYEFDVESTFYPWVILIDLYLRQGKSSAVKKLLSSHFRRIKELETNRLRWMTREDRNALGRGLSTVHAFSIMPYLPEGTFEEVLFDAALFSKTLLLNLHRETADNVCRIGSPQLSEAYHRMQAFGGTTASWMHELDFLKAYKKYSLLPYDWNYTWKDVQKGLKHNEVAVEFLRAGQGFSDYYALIVKRGWKRPVVIKIGTEEQYRKFRSDAGTHRDDAAQLGKMVLAPLEPYLTHGDHLYFASDGQLSFLNFDAFVLPDGELAGEKYRLHRVSTTAHVSEVKQDGPYDNLFLFGGMDYSVPYEELSSAVSKYHAVLPLEMHEWKRPDRVSYDIDDFSDLAEEEREGFESLRYSGFEVESIAGLWPYGHGVQSWSGKAASEECFKYLGHSCDPSEKNIFHIATHSFSIIIPDEYEGLTIEEYSFKSCGLLFAGGRNAVEQSTLSSDVCNDGLLFSEEIADMDLSSADLVVLSACSTARGIDTLDGVYGLQRAFKYAGAKTVIMTLWRVNDKATASFMTSFYEALFSGNDKYSSFKIAQKTIRNEYHGDPFYWAPFIMLD